MEQCCEPKGKTILGKKLGSLLEDEEGVRGFPIRGKRQTHLSYAQVPVEKN